ncbi:SMC-Scp complex subunit ScpB [Tichowtungia aerotolerans]|uniref:SMC-Scp complex subunit ScpB n=1 Tax=Tichowtungia aerotolerans TaxID=2697043 RepID=A0A6P1M6U5_9BACT|nr:SMC-Scp complex subunit ScpB [Tichowtungia aerotolerans]QHI69577.1 SMC-Scp complex subunit ScpB [Tichowtungia aerotolerans]
MSDVEILPELKEIIGSLLFAAKKPLTAKEIRKALIGTGENYGGPYEQFTSLKENEILEAIEGLKEELSKNATGLHVADVAHGFRLQNNVACGPWVRTMLDKDRTTKLSKPALETLAIVAYRQPVLRSEIESVRGVSVDSILRNLVELQLVKVVGRSELPGRPWMFGTTQRFLEHFGLKSLDDMPGMDELKRREMEAGEGEKTLQTNSFPAIEKELEGQAETPTTEGDDNEPG